MIEDGGELTLLDASWPRSWPHIERAVSQLGRSPGDARAVVLTHGHPDHLGAAERARQACGAPVMAYRDEVPRVRGEGILASPSFPGSCHTSGGHRRSGSSSTPRGRAS